MRLHPLFKWFGSKWQSAKKYPYPVRNVVVEPFAGGAGYALNHSEKDVVIWDEDPNVAALWRWIINDASKQDVLDIPIDLPEGYDIRALGLSRGQALLLKHWQRTNNVGECWTVSPWGNKPGQWTANTRARVAEEIQYVKHWKFEDPYLWIDTPCTWFIDPPYQYNYQYRASLPKIDYEQIDSLVQTINPKSLVICCEAVGKNGEVPEYLPFKRSHESVTSRRKSSQSHHSKELVYIREGLL